MIELPAIPSSSEMGCEPEPLAAQEFTPCDPTPKPGVEAFRNWAVAELGGGRGGITRSCTGEVGTSQHHAGRAWDWMVNASDPADMARASALIEWLLAPDAEGNEHAMFRRAGLAYIIWNRESWYAWRPHWQPYTRENPHTDHVHFSFSKAGADGLTSFYEWLGMEPKPAPPPGPPGPTPLPSEPSIAVPMTVGGFSFLAAAITTFYLAEHVPKMVRHKRSRAE